jgi:conjugative transposon TraN protein
MKQLLFVFALFCAVSSRAQSPLPVVYLPANATLHFISPEPIQYVDISTKEISGDLPLKNVLRLKLRDSIRTISGSAFPIDAVITIAGERFIAQYHLSGVRTDAASFIEIVPSDTRPLDISGIGFSQNQLKAMAMGIAASGEGNMVRKKEAFGISGRLNHVYTAGDYIFLDISYRNKTNLKYDIDDLRFKIEDKKVTKAANAQSFEIKPEFILFATAGFSRHYRNIFVFKKLTFPGNKQFRVELSEHQVSGRVLNLDISYKDILNADLLPN